MLLSALLHRPRKAAGYAVPTATAPLCDLLYCLPCVARLKEANNHQIADPGCASEQKSSMVCLKSDAPTSVSLWSSSSLASENTTSSSAASSPPEVEDDIPNARLGSGNVRCVSQACAVCGLGGFATIANFDLAKMSSKSQFLTSLPLEARHFRF